MFSFLLRQILLTVFILLFTSFGIFSLIYYSKGSVVYAKIPQAISQEIKTEIEKNLGLHEPLLTQYTTWLKKAIKGDFSYSLISGERVLDVILERLPNTLLLTFCSFVLLVVFSLLLALLSLIYRHSIINYLIEFGSMSFFALPTFCLCLLLILLLSIEFKIFPSSGLADIGMEDDFWNRSWHLVLPILALTLSHLLPYVKFIQSTLLENLKFEFIEASFARGLSKTRIYAHLALKSASIPIITYFGTTFTPFVMGSFIVEGVFTYPGIGLLSIQSIIYKDYPITLAITLLSILMVMLVHTLIQILCRCIDSRL